MIYFQVFHASLLQKIAARSDWPRNNWILAAASCDIESHSRAAQHISQIKQIKRPGDFMSRLHERFVLVLIVLGIFPDLLRSQATTSGTPIRIKVVVVAMFERGEDTGDAPGEYQLWVEREHLDQIIPLPAGYHHVRLNKDGVLGILTGVGTAKAAASVMAAGLDPRFDLSKAYWIVAGIGGGDPLDVSLGLAVWAEHVLDGVLARLKNERVGQCMDALLHWRQRELHDFSHGRHRHDAGAHLLESSQSRGFRARIGAAHGKQLRPRAAGHDRY